MAPHEAKKLLYRKGHHHLRKVTGHLMEKSIPHIYLIEGLCIEYIKKKKWKSRTHPTKKNLKKRRTKKFSKDDTC